MSFRLISPMFCRASFGLVYHLSSGRRFNPQNKKVRRKQVFFSVQMGMKSERIGQRMKRGRFMSEELGYENIKRTLEERFHQTMALHLRCTCAEIL